ncbi:MAG: polysaccharide deacetylase family protein [Muribaculaceae bacterium]|nr:polysaccharide deacetylase family protein [Roseburia sp.]MCM1430166.1 polysaccharide deacetylase family protein [Muribaculaceae bacterium]MCM1493096.1 polysaccharide deacetylase family protein [Muribaculaceae bacterium]
MGQKRTKERRRAAAYGIILALAFILGRVAAHGFSIEWEAVIRLADAKKDEEKEVEKGRELPKQIAITFDDGPNPLYTEKLLEGLKKREVKATFFLLGSEVEEYPKLVEKIYDDGHLIGVHSYRHVNFGEIGDEAAMKQIDAAREAIYSVTGEYAGFIRPPYGCWKDSLNDKVPMIEVLWDVDPLDWATADADTVAQRILKAVDKGGTIILLHDASQSSVQAAFTVIDALTEQGYEFVTVEELLLE